MCTPTPAFLWPWAFHTIPLNLSLIICKIGSIIGVTLRIILMMRSQHWFQMSPREHLETSGDTFDCDDLRGSATCIWWVETRMLLPIPPGTGQPPRQMIIQSKILMPCWETLDYRIKSDINFHNSLKKKKVCEWVNTMCLKLISKRKGLSWSDLGSNSDSATCWEFEFDFGEAASALRLLNSLLVK